MKVDLNIKNFGYYALHSRSDDLSRKDKNIALALSILMGFTLGLGHLICFLFFNKKVGLDSSKTAPRTHEVGTKALEVQNNLTQKQDIPTSNNQAVPIKETSAPNVMNVKIFDESLLKSGVKYADEGKKEEAIAAFKEYLLKAFDKFKEYENDNEMLSKINKQLELNIASFKGLAAEECFNKAGEEINAQQKEKMKKEEMKQAQEKIRVLEEEIHVF